jgi:hypothetical protein
MTKAQKPDLDDATIQIAKRLLNTPPKPHSEMKLGKRKARAIQNTRLSHRQPFTEAFEELELLLKQPGCSGSAANSVLQVIQHLDKCVRMKFAYETAARTGKATIVLEPSDLFTNFVSAFRAQDWPLVSIIEHEICSSSAEMNAPSA